MKVGILTFHRADNYGALLQTYALQTKLIDMKQDVQIIDYRCNAIEDRYDYKLIPEYRNNLKSWLYVFVKGIYSTPKKKVKARRCSEFRKNWLYLTKSFYGQADRRLVQEEYDLIITGSDQIWNPDITLGKDDWYCFKKETDNKCRLASYGASIGNIKTFRGIFDEYKDDLEQYTYLSVREKETRGYLESQLNKPVFSVLDPTLIVPVDTWKQLMDKSEICIKGKYVLYYDVEQNPVSKIIAQTIAKKENLKLIHFSDSIDMIGKGHYAQDAGPIEFLWLIRNAQVVVTSSFHATVFSILFKKQFITIPHFVTGIRVANLLKELKLEDRTCKSMDDYSDDMVRVAIDYTQAYQLLGELQKEANDYLTRIMEG